MNVYYLFTNMNIRKYNFYVGYFSIFLTVKETWNKEIQLTCEGLLATDPDRDLAWGSL